MSVKLVFGEVSDTKPGYAKVQLPEYDNIVTDWLPIMKRRAMNDDENWPLELNEQVACLLEHNFDQGHGDRGVILGACSNDVDTPDSSAAAGKDRRSYNDGGSDEYDTNSHKRTIVLAGNGTFALSNQQKSFAQIMQNIVTHINEAIYINGAGSATISPATQEQFQQDLLDLQQILS